MSLKIFRCGADDLLLQGQSPGDKAAGVLQRSKTDAQVDALLDQINDGVGILCRLVVLTAPAAGAVYPSGGQEAQGKLSLSADASQSMRAVSTGMASPISVPIHTAYQLDAISRSRSSTARGCGPRTTTTLHCQQLSVAS